MVAPVQSTVGTTSTDPSTQNYLTELTNFYRKPENEGIRAEFTAPDGMKYTIEDASYLSKVTSDVNSGKRDIPAVQDSNKSVSKKADMNLDDSEYAKNKKEGSGQKDSGKKPELDGNVFTKGKQIIKDLPNKGRETKSQGESDKAVLDSSKAETQKIQDETTKIFEQMDATNNKIVAVSKQNQVKVKQAFDKAKQTRAAQAAKQADAALSAGSKTQSGSTLGFEGKLATTGGGISGSNSAAMDKAWADTMNGKINISVGTINNIAPKLLDVKQEGEKAAQPLLDQSKATRDAAGNTLDSVQGQNLGAAGTIVGTVASIVTSIAMLTNPITAVGAIALCLTGISGGVGAYKQFEGAAKTRDVYEGQLDQATQLHTQASIARRQAVAKSDVINGKALIINNGIPKLIEELNAPIKESSGGGLLSTSAIGGTNTDGMDESQLKDVKAQREAQILNHEKCHSAVIGGTPVVEYDANGIAIGGYVKIDIPSVNESDLEGTMEKAQRVIDAALAPSDPSSQDQNVASQAKSVLAKAQSLLKEKAEKAQEAKQTKEESKEEKVEAPKDVADELKK